MMARPTWSQVGYARAITDAAEQRYAALSAAASRECQIAVADDFSDREALARACDAVAALEAAAEHRAKAESWLWNAEHRADPEPEAGS